MITIDDSFSDMKTATMGTSSSKKGINRDEFMYWGGMLLDFGATPFRSLENDGNAHFQNSVFNFKEDNMISKGKSWRYSQSRFNMNSRGWATIICYKKLTTRNQAFFGGGGWYQNLQAQMKIQMKLDRNQTFKSRNPANQEKT